MNTAQQVPVLFSVDAVILGATTSAVQEALALTREKKEVVLITRASFLGTERFVTLEQAPGTIPDEEKKHLEALCRESGVHLLYMAWLLDQIPAEDGRILVRLGGKFGVAGVLAGTVLDRRPAFSDDVYRAYLTRREKPEETCVLEVQNPAPAQAPQARRLLEARLAVLRHYGEDGIKEKYSLGRFALRGSGPKAQTAPEPAAQTRRRVLSRMDPQSCGRYPRLETDSTFSGTESSWDLVVAGGGTAGTMAALTAARKGLRVAVLEPNDALGGTGTVGGVSAYWFGTRYRDTAEIDELVKAFTNERERNTLPGIWGGVDSWNPDVKATALLQLLLDAGVTVLFGHMAFGVWEENGKVAGIAAAGEEGVSFLRAPYLFDATGDGDLAVFAGAACVYGNDHDAVTYWASLAQYPTAGTYRNNFSAMMCLDDPLDHTRFVMTARGFGGNLFDHGACGCVRESRHICGKTRLTLRDLVCHTHYPDTLYTCYSNYDPKGKVTADMVYCGALPPQTQIEIPLSALLPVRADGTELPGLYVLGKAISVSHDLFPSIRMQKDLMHQGAVMGNLAADCLHLGKRPENLTPAELRELLRDYSDDPLRAPQEGEIPPADCVRALCGGVRSHWVDADFTDCEMQFQPYLSLLCAPSEQVLPLVEAALKSACEEKARPWLLRLAVWHGGRKYGPELARMVLEQLGNSGLPPRRGATTCAQLLPDHGVMPEAVYDLDLLAYADPDCCAEPFRVVCERLIHAQRDYESITQGVFPYVESFAFVAERNGSPAILDEIEKLIDLPELQAAGTLPDEDLLKERFLLLRYLLFRALAANGRRKGYDGLAAYLTLPQQPLARSALITLRRLTGTDFGVAAGQWRQWIESQTVLPQGRITEKIF